MFTWSPMFPLSCESERWKERKRERGKWEMRVKEREEERVVTGGEIME